MAAIRDNSPFWSGERQAGLLVKGVWLASTLIALVFVWQFSSDIPRKDDWQFVMGLAEPGLPGWVWFFAQLDLNIQPVARLIMWLNFELSGGSLKPAMIGGVLMLSLSCFVSIQAVRKIRGRSTFQDAFLPMVILTLGHANAWLWFLTSVVGSYPIALSIICLSILSVPSWRSSKWGLWVLGIGLIILPGFGSLGLAIVFGFAIVLILMLSQGGQEPRVRRGLILLLGLLALETGAYLLFIDWSLGNSAGKFSSPGGVLIAAIQSGTMGFGQFNRRLWPLSGLILVSLVFIVSLIMVSRLRRTDKNTRWEVLIYLGLLAVFLGSVGAIGLGRSLQGGLNNRYTLYALPLAVVIYFCWVRWAPKNFRALGEFLLFGFVCSGWLFNASGALAHGKSILENQDKLLADVASGLPARGLAINHEHKWGINLEEFYGNINAYKQAGLAPFSQVREDPVMNRVSVREAELKINNGLAAGDAWRFPGRDFSIELALAQPRHIYGVEMHYVLRSERRGASEFQASWMDASGGKQQQYRLVNFNTAVNPRPEVYGIWIDKEIRSINISPSAVPGEFTLKELVLLVPGEAEGL